MLYRCGWQTPLGPITLASDGTALTGLWFDGQQHFPEECLKDGKTEDLPVFKETKDWLAVYFGGQVPPHTPLLRPSGTPFQEKIWKLLLSIPYGQIRSYGEIAASVSVPPHRTSARAVGQAVGRNPISLLIPCHRVVGADGSLTGYAGGKERKAWLLSLEAGSRQGLPRTDHLSGRAVQHNIWDFSQNGHAEI